MGRHSTTDPGHAIAAAAPSNHSAVRRLRCAESRAASTSRPAMLPGQRQRPKHSSSLAVIESASRCCSPISSAYSGSAGYAYGDQGAPSSSSRWLLSLKTSGGSPNSWCDRRRLHRSALRRSCVTQGHRKQFPASGAADGRTTPSKASCATLLVVVADFRNEICHNRTHELHKKGRASSQLTT